MIIERPATARGQVDGGWLDSRHTFSFGSYHDPAWMGFGVLRVINDDRVAPGAGFAPHRHANMEIVSIVLEGALAHRDSTGNEGVIRAGDVQWMSAGHGVEHSEFNASGDAPVHFLQVWVQPDRSNAAPAYAQRDALDAEPGQWSLLVSPDGDDGSLPIRQDARIRSVLLNDGDAAEYAMDPLRRHWLHVATGEATVDQRPLAAGDALGFQDEDGTLHLRGRAGGTRVLLFDLPGATTKPV